MSANHTRKSIHCLFSMLLLVCSTPGLAADDRRLYHVDYKIELQPKTHAARVEIKLGKGAEYVRWIRLQIDPEYHTGFKGSGSIEKQGNYVLWKPKPEGGTLGFNARIDHRRKSGTYDALFTDDWALFRGDDLVPPVRVGMLRGTKARTKLHFDLPAGWSIVTPYPRYSSGTYKVDHPHRLFDRPTGWMVAGNIGVKREQVKGVKVIVAGPKGQSVRRMDILALLNWNLPTLLDIFSGFPERILIVSAGDPMWRGALSGPDSLYVHADRPLISEDGTSPLIHEMVHVAMAARSGPGSDWLVEGLAEYYSLEIMRRSGTITSQRYEKALEQLAEYGEKASTLEAERSHGPITAKAVGVLRALDNEIREKTNNKASLDNVVQALAAQRGEITLERVRKIAEQVAGTPLKTLADIP